MRAYIENNLIVIKKHFAKRKKSISKLNKLSIKAEFKEWIEDPQAKKEMVWTLPDLTSPNRLKNFCRSIKKELS